MSSCRESICPMLGKKHQKMKCCVPSCNVNVHVINHQFSWQMICAAVGIASINEGESLLPLCASHYQLVYRLSNPEKLQTIQCKVCGIKCKHACEASEKHFLPCPEPQMVELFLKETVQFNGCLREGDASMQGVSK